MTGPNSVECRPIRNRAPISSVKILLYEADGADDHDADLEELDVADDARLVVLVGDLAGGRGKQKERQNEKPGTQIYERCPTVTW